MVSTSVCTSRRVGLGIVRRIHTVGDGEGGLGGGTELTCPALWTCLGFGLVSFWHLCATSKRPREPSNILAVALRVAGCEAVGPFSCIGSATRPVQHHEAKKSLEPYSTTSTIDIGDRNPNQRNTGLGDCPQPISQALHGQANPRTCPRRAAASM